MPSTVQLLASLLPTRKSPLATEVFLHFHLQTNADIVGSNKPGLLHFTCILPSHISQSFKQRHVNNMRVWSEICATRYTTGESSVTGSHKVQVCRYQPDSSGSIGYSRAGVELPLYQRNPNLS
jgi:hypothetical protein